MDVVGSFRCCAQPALRRYCPASALRLPADQQPGGGVRRAGGLTVQPIHRTSCQGIRPLSASCLVDHLAALIDGQAQACREPAGSAGGNSLIWVEGEFGPADGCSRGMIVVGHGPNRAAMKRFLVISYPLGAGDGRSCLHAVSNALRRLDWSVVASRCRKTATRCANTAVLVNHARPGGQQRLLLAEPVQATRQRPAAPMPKRRDCVPRRAVAVRPARLARAAGPARTARDHAEARVNEGAVGNGATG